MEQAFMDGQAGILASKLKEGEKCPVCGSTTHPQPAGLSDKVPSEKELEDAKKIMDKSREVREKYAREAEGAARVVNTKKDDIEKHLKKLLGVETIADGKKAIDREEEKVNEKLLALEKEVKSLTIKAKRFKELEELIPSRDKEIQDNSEKTGHIRESIAAKESEIRNGDKQLEELKKGLEFENKNAALAKMEELKSRAVKINKAYDEAKKNLDSQNKVVLEIEAVIRSNTETIENSDAVDLEAERDKQGALKLRQKQCVDHGKVVNARVDTNRSIKKNVLGKAGNISVIEKELQWARALSDTANGKLKGKDKVMLETYIQMTYFDKIIERANLRLMTMSSGQYELIRMKEASDVKSQSGLDLGVIDHYNGTQRSVKTLSGGESFIASLSLALGLSDEVQASAGGIQIDTMFVDEGFGTLDSDTLDQAYRALAGLTDGNRLVGIISHVSDFKERIDKQIVVTKEKTGGSFVKITA